MDSDPAHVQSRSDSGRSRAPLDREWLGRWIQPHHLTEEALDRYGDAYRQGRIPYLRLAQFLPAATATRLYQLLSAEVDYEDIYGLYEPDARVTREEWLAADVDNRMFKFRKMKGVRPGVQSMNPLFFARLRDALADRRFVTFFERITGTALGETLSFSGSAYGVGDYLRPHHDSLSSRRLAYIIYLNPNWKPEFGGALHIVGHDGEEHVLEVEHNSLVVFDVMGHKYHYIADIQESAGREDRLTLGGWIADAA